MPDELSIIWPIEFVVIGVAVSFQASSRGKDAWKKLVSEACREQISPSVFRPTIPLSVVIYHFPDGKMGDIDNTVKPILDAMEGIAYHDDNVVERLTAQKFEPGHLAKWAKPSTTLFKAISGQKPITYVMISPRPHEEIV